MTKKALAITEQNSILGWVYSDRYRTTIDLRMPICEIDLHTGSKTHKGYPVYECCTTYKRKTTYCH